MQCVFFGRLWVALKRACFCGQVAVKRTSCLQQMFKMMACPLSSAPVCQQAARFHQYGHCTVCHCSLSTVPVSLSFFSNPFKLCFVQPLLEKSHITCHAFYPLIRRQMLWWSRDHPTLSAGTALHWVRAPGCRSRATAENRSPRSTNWDSLSHRRPIWCRHVAPPGQLQSEFVLAHSRL